MSKDFEIRSDDRYLASVNRQELVIFLASLPYVTILEDRYGEYNLPGQSAFLPIYLVLYSETGEDVYIDNRMVAPADQDRVNAIQLHLSAGIHQTDSVYQAYLQLGFIIADHLKWRIYDCDADVYLDPVR